jgi:hypothetical protein
MILVAVRIKTDPVRAAQAMRDDPELNTEFQNALKSCGLVRTERWIGDGEIVDFDWWESHEDRARFNEQHADLLRRWQQAIGQTSAEAYVWRSPTPEEEWPFPI